MSNKRGNSPARVSIQQYGRRVYLVRIGKASWYRPRFLLLEALERAGLSDVPDEEVTYEKETTEPNAGI